MTNGAEAYYKSEHKSNPARIEVPEDVDRMIDYLLSGAEKYHTGAKVFSLDRPTLPSGFSGHEFFVGVNPETRKGAIVFGCEQDTLATVGDVNNGHEPIYHVMGQEEFFPEDCELPVDLIREAVKEFALEGGIRPSCVEWKLFE